MKKADALKLHNEDEVTIKETGAVTRVLDAYFENENSKYVTVECEDGNTYTHLDIK